MSIGAVRTLLYVWHSEAIVSTAIQRTDMFTPAHGQGSSVDFKDRLPFDVQGLAWLDARA
ncbi:MAG: hypothetical protein NVS2B7_35210 [Herpetosiphon sp.]